VKILFSYLLTLLCLCCFSQQRSFDVVLLGKNIGQTSIVKKQDEKGFVTYNLRSNTSVSVMFQEKTSSMSFDVKYYGGKLFSALCKVVNNGSQVITEITKEAEGYIIKKENELLKIAEAITFSSMELYFTEPINEKRVFSERLGEFVAFEKTAPGEYVNRLKDVTNIYRYRNGTLYEVEIRKPLGSVYLKARN
jgi:hypothetical protein